MKKILALLCVDEDALEQTEGTFEEEMGWVSQSGISMEDYIEIDESNESQRFLVKGWNLNTL